MYVIKNSRANPNLRSPINRPEYHSLDSEIQSLYRFDAGVDEGDDNFHEAYADNASLDDGPTTLMSTELSDESSLSSPEEDGKSDSFEGYGGGSFGGGGSESEY